MGWLQVFTDWQQVKKEKAEFLQRFRQVPPGASLSIKVGSKPPAERAITERAIMELLLAHPNTIEAIDFGFEVTLMRKADMARITDKQNYEHLHNNFGILNADGVVTQNLHKGHDLTPHRLRGGVPDNYNEVQNSEDAVKTIITQEDK